MRTKEFRVWLLDQPIGLKPGRDCLSRCKTVEKSLKIDLEKEYKKDRCAAVLQKMQYSIKDQKENKPIPECFNFKPGSNVKNRLCDLRSAVKKYIAFSDELLKVD